MDLFCENWWLLSRHRKDGSLFDTFDYPVDSVYGMPIVNKNVFGKMKDALKNVLLWE